MIRVAFILLAAILLEGCLSKVAQAENLAPAISRYLVPPKTAQYLISELETKIAELALTECANSTLGNHFECMLEGAHEACNYSKIKNKMECLALADIFTSIYTSRRTILGPYLVWRLRKASATQRIEIMLQASTQYATQLARKLKWLAPACPEKKDLQCESEHLEAFCLNHSYYNALPASVCLSLILKHKIQQPE